MIRRPLGRGLDALIENTRPGADGAGGPDAAGMMLVAIDRIVPGPFQPRQRFDPERLQELTRAIQTQGVIEPLVVRRVPAGAESPARYELIAGERRLRAARNAALSEVPVIVRKLDDRAALEMSLVENLAREDLNAVEEGRGLARLSREFGLGHDEIANRIGKSRPYVSNAIRLLELPEPVLEMIARGELTAGQARPLLAIGSAHAQIDGARRIVEGGLNSRGAEQLAAEHRARRSSSARRVTVDPNLAALADNLQRTFKRKVRIVRRRGKHPGRIELEYYDENDLNALTAALMGLSRAAGAASV